MARLTAPLMSLTASGTLGKAITFSSWKGIAYARTRVIPFNPNTADQQEVRGVFSTLCEMWKRMPTLARAPWTAAAKGRPLTARNQHIKSSAAALKGETTLDKLAMSISGGNAVPAATFVVTPGSGELALTVTLPELPPGYTHTSTTFAICLDGDPSPVLVTETQAHSEDSPTLTYTFETLEEAAYQAAAWLVWERTSDSKVFYSAASRDQGTPTA